MGKVSPKDRGSKSSRQKRRSRSSVNKYLKPGALAQLRYSKTTFAVKSCTDLGKKRVALVDAARKVDGGVFEIGDNVVAVDSEVLSPKRFCFSPIASAAGAAASAAVNADDGAKLRRSLAGTPKTPISGDYVSESRLEGLPMDLLVRILCYLHHDQLRAVFHVSQRVRKAVLLARQLHFNYTTPDRSRQEMLRTMTPLPTDHWPFVRGDSKGLRMLSPHAPKAPKHGPRPPSRLKQTEMRQVAAVLFQEPCFSSRCVVPSVLPKPPCKNRVLFYEDELCQAVAQNKLR